MKSYIETVLLSLSLWAFWSAQANTIDNCSNTIYETIAIDTSKNPYSDCDLDLKYKLTHKQAKSLQKKSTDININDLTPAEKEKNDKWINALIDEYPIWISFDELINKKLKAESLFDDLVNIAGGYNISEKDIVTFFSWISNFLCTKKRWVYIFFPITDSKVIDYNLFIKYPELYSILKETHPKQNKKAILETHIYYFDNSKEPGSHGLSGAWKKIFIEQDTSKKVQSSWEERLLLNELTGDIFEKSFWEQSWSKNLYREEETWDVYYFVNDNFTISTSDSHWKKTRADEINELLWDLFCSKEVVDAETVDHFLLKWFRYFICSSSEDTIAIDEIVANCFEDAYWKSSYTYTWKFIFNHLEEIYSLYGWEERYKQFMERAPLKTAQGKERHCDTDRKHLTEQIMQNPELFQQWAEKKFNCMTKNLRDCWHGKQE